MSAQFSWTPQGKQFLKRLEALSNPQKVSLIELFTPNFMQNNTQFSSFEAMLEASGFRIESSDDFLAISDAQWDQFISQQTQFTNWQEMLNAAAVELVKKQLEFS